MDNSTPKPIIDKINEQYPPISSGYGLLREAANFGYGLSVEEYKTKVITLLWNHYKENGGYTRTAANVIEKLTGEKWEKDSEYEKLEGRIKELECKVEDLNKCLDKALKIKPPKDI